MKDKSTMKDKSNKQSTATTRSAAGRARARSAQLRADEARRQALRSAITQALVIGVGAVVVLAVVIAVLVGRGGTPESAGSAPAHTTAEGGHVVGAADAPVTVTLVEDFQCPACQAFEEQSGGVLNEYVDSGEVKVEYRPIAFLDRMSSTSYSSRALNAAACVLDAEPGDFKAFHDLLFAHQPPEHTAGLSDQDLTDLAGQAGAPGDRVASCISDGTFSSWASSTTSEVTNDPEFKGTPWVRVNRTTVQDRSASGIETAITDALAGQ